MLMCTKFYLTHCSCNTTVFLAFCAWQALLRGWQLPAATVSLLYFLPTPLLFSTVVASGTLP